MLCVHSMYLDLTGWQHAMCTAVCVIHMLLGTQEAHGVQGKSAWSYKVHARGLAPHGGMEP